RDAEEALDDVEAERARCGCGARRGFDAEARDAGVANVAQQVAVVGGDLADEARRREREARPHRLDVGARMSEPRRRKRAEVGVVGAEQGLAAGVVLGLDEPAALADEQAQRIPDLGGAQRRLAQVGVRGRRAAEIEADAVEVGGAVAALHGASPAKSAPTKACASSRGESAAIGSGQSIARRGSRGCRPPSALDAYATEWQ